MVTNGAPFGPGLCKERADECLRLARETGNQSVRVMLEHVSTTWARIAEKLVNPED
jgi:hypothetical protein